MNSYRALARPLSKNHYPLALGHSALRLAHPDYALVAFELLLTLEAPMVTPAANDTHAPVALAGVAPVLVCLVTRVMVDGQEAGGSKRVIPFD
jgi:hypothetical protein